MAGPVVCTDRAGLDDRLEAAREQRARIGLVPTMGALHEGHLSLLRSALRRCEHVVMSIFVNPLQFGPEEDYERYPRTMEADLRTLSRELPGPDACSVYVPDVAELYPHGLEDTVGVEPGALGRVLEGAVRPTHFRGVLTVVAKLLGLVRPDEAWFGEKDYQQLVVIRRMVEELVMPAQVCAAPIVREPDGLALSSRNRYLDAEQRRLALALPRALARGASAASPGAGQPAEVVAQVRAGLDRAGLQIEYVALTDPDLGPPPAHGPARLLAAVRIGSTRLLDNTMVDIVGDRAG